MITSFLFLALTGVVSGIVGALPAWTWPAATGNGAAVGSFAHTANAVFPVDALFLAVAFGLSFALLLGAIDLAMFVWHQIHGAE